MVLTDMDRDRDLSAVKPLPPLLNAPVSTFNTPSPRVTFSSRLPAPMVIMLLVIVAGRPSKSRVWSFRQPLRKPLPMLCTLSGMRSEVSAPQLLNAELPMEVTPPPSSASASLVQPSKALLPMGAPSVAPVMDVQPANA